MKSEPLEYKKKKTLIVNEGENAIQITYAPSRFITQFEKYKKRCIWTIYDLSEVIRYDGEKVVLNERGFLSINPKIAALTWGDQPKVFRELIGVAILFTNDALLKEVAENAPRSKDGSLSKNRKRVIAVGSGVLSNRKYFALTSKNISNTSIELKFDILTLSNGISDMPYQRCREVLNEYSELAESMGI